MITLLSLGVSSIAQNVAQLHGQRRVPEVERGLHVRDHPTPDLPVHV